MKTTKPLFKQLHESQELVKQKQSDIDELVSELEKIKKYGVSDLELDILIQKHTKK